MKAFMASAIFLSHLGLFVFQAVNFEILSFFAPIFYPPTFLFEFAQPDHAVPPRCLQRDHKQVIDHILFVQKPKKQTRSLFQTSLASHSRCLNPWRIATRDTGGITLHRSLPDFLI